MTAIYGCENSDGGWYQNDGKGDVWQNTELYSIMFPEKQLSIKISTVNEFQ